MAAQRIGDIVYNMYCKYTGVPFNCTVYDELPVNAILDDAIWFENLMRLGGGFLKRNTGANPLDIRWWGVKGDWNPNLETGTDDGGNFQRALNSLDNNPNTLYIPSPLNIMTTAELITPFSCNGSAIISDGASTYKRARITTPENINAIIRCKAQGFTFNNIQFEATGVTSNTVGVNFKRADVPDEGNDNLNDIDATVRNCNFGNLKNSVECWGRQLWFQDNQISQVESGVVIKKLNTTGLFGGPNRAYRIWRNSFHAINRVQPDGDYTENGCIVVDSDLAYGMSIMNNFSDCFATFFNGHLTDSILTGNECYHIVGYGAYLKTLNRSKVTNNHFINTNRYAEGPGGTNPPYATRGIRVLEPATYSNISDNYISLASTTAIKFDKGGQGNIVARNTIERWDIASTGVAAIELEETSTTGLFVRGTVQGNIFVNPDNRDLVCIRQKSNNQSLVKYGNKFLEAFTGKTTMYDSPVGVVGDEYVSAKKPEVLSRAITASTYTLTNEDHTLLLIPAADQTITLPQMTQGRTVNIILSNSSRFKITIVPNSGSSWVFNSVLGAYQFTYHSGWRISGGVLGDILSGSGSPNGVVTAYQAMLYRDVTNGDIYLKKTGHNTNGGWLKMKFDQGGNTASRPTSPGLYETYYDTTITKPIWWNGANWKDATGATV